MAGAGVPGGDTRAGDSYDVVLDSSIQLLGGFQVLRGGALVELPESAQRLIAFLLLNRRTASRRHITVSLWPDAADERAAASLRSLLWRIRQAVHGLIHVAGSDVRLATDVHADIDDLLTARDDIQRLLDPNDHRLLRRLLDQRDELLPGWYNDWVIAERERLREIRIHTLEVLCERLADAGRFTTAIEAGIAAVRMDPLRESSNVALVSSYLAEGNLARAIACAATYRELVSRELGVEPSPRMVDVIERGMSRSATR